MVTPPRISFSRYDSAANKFPRNEDEQREHNNRTGLSGACTKW
jgi:hypothetical protein